MKRDWGRRVSELKEGIVREEKKEKARKGAKEEGRKNPLAKYNIEIKYGWRFCERERKKELVGFSLNFERNFGKLVKKKWYI